jgi:hypothetical protein
VQVEFGRVEEPDAQQGAGDGTEEDKV